MRTLRPIFVTASVRWVCKIWRRTVCLSVSVVDYVVCFSLSMKLCFADLRMGVRNRCCRGLKVWKQVAGDEKPEKSKLDST